jgi:hypothetical protein
VPLSRINDNQTVPSPIHSDRRWRGLRVAFARGARNSVVASDQENGVTRQREGGSSPDSVCEVGVRDAPPDTAAVAARDCTPESVVGALRSDRRRAENATYRRRRGGYGAAAGMTAFGQRCRSLII